MSSFDTFVMIDWSGGNDRGATPKADAIWAAVARADGGEPAVYLRNRTLAEAWIGELIAAERAAGRRMLIGFDFPFGYPAGFGRALTGSEDPLTVLAWFSERINDTPKANNRFEIAGQINRTLGNGIGPFWGNAQPKQDVAGLARTKAGYANPFPDRRACEQLAKSSFTCWQLAGAGAVGSQVMMGLPVLARLRQHFGARVWPFETLDSDVALVEIWPSLTAGPAPEDMIKDQWQVMEVARQIAELAPETLAKMLAVDAPVEGWIFGLGFEDQLRGVPPLRNDCFALPAGVHWTPAGEALALLEERLTTVARPEKIKVSDALGRVLARDVVAQRSNPPLPNTAIDGYGFAGGRDAGLHALPLATGRAAAGDAPINLPAGQAIRVLTGAALPAGVDTVVLQEDVLVAGGEVRFHGPVKHGNNTRKAGEDVAQGQMILPKGRAVTPADLALMAAVGVNDVTACRPLRVGILSTGDELIEAGSPAEPQQIYDANRPMLMAIAARWGHSVVDLGRAPDDRAKLRAMLHSATDKVDAILSSGGASAGDEDHMAALLTEAGAMDLWRIAIKPGRPLALGMWRGVPVFGLPGNPVAAMVCALIFARPALAVMSGADWPEPQGFDVPAGFSKRKKAGRREYLRARVRDGRAEVFASEGSGRISGLTWAEGLVELDEAAQEITPDTPVRFVPFASFGI